MGIRIALAGNPNCGKTTLFNALTGANQYVGNWPGVTVEKKEGKLKKHDDVTVTDLPGIYSLSPYTLEEVVARNYLINERPDVVLNLVDGTNLERNLYLTTQITEIGIPVVVAVNMIDVVKKNGDSINLSELSRQLGCRVVEMSALKGTGVMEAAEAAIEAAKSDKTIPQHTFSGPVEHAIAHIEEAVIHDMASDRQRWYAIKLFERDSEVIKTLGVPEEKLAHIESDIKEAERELDDDAESIITNERYVYVASVIKSCYKKKSHGTLSTSDKIDRVVTNRIAALPIFVAIMFVVYYIAIGTLGTYVTDWTNDGLLGDGWYLFGIGRGDYDEDYEAFDEAYSEAIEALADELAIDGVDADVLADAINGATQYGDELEDALYDSSLLTYTVENSDGTYTDVGIEVSEDSEAAAALLAAAETEPDNADYGIWIPGAAAAAEAGLEAIDAADWVISLVVDGIIGGLAAPIGFVPQMAIVFLLLGFLEDCGYMARVAFIMDRIFRRFGLSGKSFIPFLISSGCGVPGIMATRTIENEKDRRMTMITTTAIPCGAKLPVIATIAGFLAGAWWVAPVMYFIGIATVILSCLILKKTKMFAGEPAPFVIELPAYHLPMVKNLLLHMWERVWAFIKKAGTILFLCCVVMWFLGSYGFGDEGFGLVNSDQSLLASIGGAIAFIFAPLGFDTWQAVASSLSGFVAKEGIVSTMGLLANIGEVEEYADSMYAAFAQFFPTGVAAFSFLTFNLLDSPCLAAISTMAREMHSKKGVAFALVFQNLFAYCLTLVVYQFGYLFVYGELANVVFFIAAVIVLALGIYLIVRPNPYNKKKAGSASKEKQYA